MFISLSSPATGRGPGAEVESHAYLSHAGLTSDSRITITGIINTGCRVRAISQRRRKPSTRCLATLYWRCVGRARRSRRRASETLLSLWEVCFDHWRCHCTHVHAGALWRANLRNV